MKNLSLFSCLIVILLLVICVNKANAEKLADLRRGMTKLEVIQLWGGPKEKIEYEIKRKDEWIYEGGRAIFVNGRLDAWFKGEGERMILQVEPTPMAPPDAAEVKVREQASQSVVDDILSEIMKDPSNDEPAAPTSAAPIPGQPVVPPAPQIEPIP